MESNPINRHRGRPRKTICSTIKKWFRFQLFDCWHSSCHVPENYGEQTTEFSLIQTKWFWSNYLHPRTFRWLGYQGFHQFIFLQWQLHKKGIQVNMLSLFNDNNTLSKHMEAGWVKEKSNSKTVMSNERWQILLVTESFQQMKYYLRNKCINVLNHSHLIMRNIHRRNSRRRVYSFRN